MDDSRRALIDGALADVVREVSENPWWRRRMFRAPPRAAFLVEGEGLDKLSAALAETIRAQDLRFEVFHDGRGPGNSHVFGFRSLERAGRERYSTNYERPDGYDRDD